MDNGDGSWSYYVEDVNGNRSYLAVPAYSTQLFTNYELFGVSSDREKFTIGPNGQLQSVFNGQCVDLQNWQSSNGTPIQIYQCG